jgi:hypothetical protein
MKSNSQISESISILQDKQAHDLVLLTKQFHKVYESFKPINLVKGAFETLSSAPDLRHKLLNNSIGYAAGYLSKKLIIGQSHSPARRTIGLIFQLAVTMVVTKYSDSLVRTGENIVHRIFGRKS